MHFAVVQKKIEPKSINISKMWLSGKEKRQFFVFHSTFPRVHLDSPRKQYNWPYKKLTENNVLYDLYTHTGIVSIEYVNIRGSSKVETAFFHCHHILDIQSIERGGGTINFCKINKTEKKIIWNEMTTNDTSRTASVIIYRYDIWVCMYII